MQHNNNAYITIPNALSHDKATYAIKVNLNSSTEPLRGHTTTSAYNIKTNLSSPTGGVEGAFTIFTTRADTIFGVTFMVLAPESELVEKLTTPEQKAEVDAYIERTKKRTERERISDRSVTGVFSGSYAINPFTGENIPIWISDYVLAGYGTGAIMAVPAHDSRDYAFAKHFGLEIRPLIEGCDVSEESFDAKEGTVCNSPKSGVETLDGFSLNGLSVKEAIKKTKEFVTSHNMGRVKVNYRLRDAIFSRQRYWGEPFPVYYKDGMPYMISEDKLPLELPEIDQYKPTETGEPPLGHAKKWAWDTEKNEVVDKSLIDNKTIFPLELNTMPGFAGSSAYYLRYMDPHNDNALVGEEADHYWQNVDLYVGGTEHATGHLIYSRFWNKFLFDLGVSCQEEPYKKLVNQGMIQGRSNFVYRVNSDDHSKKPLFVSLGLKDQYDVTPIHVDVNIVHGDVLDTEAFKAWRPRIQRRRIHPRRRQVCVRMGYREDVKVDVQRCQPRHDCRQIRSRHAASLRDVPRSGRAEQALGHQRNRRLPPLPEEVLGTVLRSAHGRVPARPERAYAGAV